MPRIIHAARHSKLGTSRGTIVRGMSHSCSSPLWVVLRFDVVVLSRIMLWPPVCGAVVVVVAAASAVAFLCVCLRRAVSTADTKPIVNTTRAHTWSGTSMQCVTDAEASSRSSVPLRSRPCFARVTVLSEDGGFVAPGAYHVNVHLANTDTYTLQVVTLSEGMPGCVASTVRAWHVRALSSPLQSSSYPGPFTV